MDGLFVTYKSGVHDQIPERRVGVAEEVDNSVDIELVDGFKIHRLVLGTVQTVHVVLVVLEVCVIGQPRLGVDPVDRRPTDGVNHAAEDVEGEGKVLRPGETPGPQHSVNDYPHYDRANILRKKKMDESVIQA